MILSFHSRVLLSFVGLAVLAQFGTIMAMLLTANRTAYDLAGQQLQVADRVLQKVLDSRELQFRSSVQTLAAILHFATRCRDATAQH